MAILVIRFFFSVIEATRPCPQNQAPKFSVEITMNVGIHRCGKINSELKNCHHYKAPLKSRSDGENDKLPLDQSHYNSASVLPIMKNDIFRLDGTLTAAHAQPYELDFVKKS
jgi:hypothetical protein